MLSICVFHCGALPLTTKVTSFHAPIFMKTEKKFPSQTTRKRWTGVDIMHASIGSQTRMRPVLNASRDLNPGKQNGKCSGENVAERENACKQKVLDTYGTVDGCTRLAKVMQAVHKLDDGTVYDETYVYADLNTAIEREKMVCWHFSRIIRTILRESGVDVECMVVQRYADSAYHSMLRWKDENNAWHYTDPTMYAETKSDLYCDMPYSLFQDTYHPTEGTCLDRIRSVAY